MREGHPNWTPTKDGDFNLITEISDLDNEIDSLQNVIDDSTTFTQNINLTENNPKKVILFKDLIENNVEGEQRRIYNYYILQIKKYN